MTIEQKRISSLFVCMAMLLNLMSQAQLTQTIRGKIVDQALQKPLEGATVAIPGAGSASVSGADGSFKITGVPVGAQQILVSFVGYKNVALDNVTVNSGKEVVLTIALDREMDTQKTVEITAKSKKNKPVNDMSLVSARAFTVEETQKFAASVNDPLRMATSFAGVISADDGSNDIVIRGNSPTGLLWRMEGVDIPNPNHFSSAGGSGGGISILSSQLLSNSDFITGAFSAEYGNALSGVFDLKLRKGNNEKREYTVQAGILGMNVAAEGPIMPFYKGSYLVNYRYSTLQMLGKLGLDVGAGGVTNFQDLSFNIYLPTTRKGDFTLFGFGGLSNQHIEAEPDSLDWDSEDDRYGGTFKSNTAAIGITHTIYPGRHSSLKSAVALSFTENDYNELYSENSHSIINTYRNKYATRKWIFSSVLNRQVGTRSILRAGVIGNLIGYNYYQKSRENDDAPVLERINSSDGTATLQAYAQWQYKASDRLNIQGGIHSLLLALNHTHFVEPRVSVRYEIDRNNSLALGYGLHSQIQALGVYFAKTPGPEGTSTLPNKDLAFTRAHHLVLSYNHAFTNTLRLKTELYYQYLFDVPVSIYDSITFSTLNIQSDYTTDALTNKGKGRNYGIDISLEKNLLKNFYFLLNTSLYQSKYRASDGVERDTRYNANHVTNLTGGKDFLLKDGKRMVGVHLKCIYAGGFRTTPIDLEGSLEKGYSVFREKEAFTLQNAAYFRTDLRVSMKWNKKNLTSTLSLDIQNLTNRQNLYGQYFDPIKGSVVNSYQTGLIPVLNYKVEF